MREIDGKMSFTPSDLSLFLNSEFASYMDRFIVTASKERIDEIKPVKYSDDEILELLKSKGLQYEAVKERELENGKNAIRIPRDLSSSEIEEQTRRAMEDGYDYIFQGRLSFQNYAGRPDVLEKVSVLDGMDSKYRDYFYIPKDIKLSETPKAEYIVQVLTYCKMLEEIQNVLPPSFGIITGDGEQYEFRTDSFLHFYNMFRQQFEKFQSEFNERNIPTPKKSDNHYDWGGFANQWLRKTDDLALVAGIKENEIQLLRPFGVDSLTKLAETKECPSQRINQIRWVELNDQARLQLESRNLDQPLYRVLEHKGAREGLERLPPPDMGDIFYDIEGYPLLGDSGLQYLHGVSLVDGKYEEFWSYTLHDEKSAFENFCSWSYKRYQEYPNMHIYHYGHYETATLKRLASSYGSCEEIIDEFLREDIFVDLARVVRQGLRIGRHSYSLKLVEHLYYPKRETEISSGADAAIAFSKFLALGDSEHRQKLLDEIRSYNIDDCESTRELANFLGRLKEEYLIPYLPPEPEEKKEPTEPTYSDQLLELAQKLRGQIPESQLGLPLEENESGYYLKEAISHLLEFHIRERKPELQEYFGRRDSVEDELKADSYTIHGIEVESTLGDNTLQGRFDPSKNYNLRLRRGDKLVDLHGEAFKEAALVITDLDLASGRIELQIAHKSKRIPYSVGDRVSLHTTTSEFIVKPLQQVIKTIAESLDEKEPYLGIPKPLGQLLLKEVPTLNRNCGESAIIDPREDLIASAIEAITEMDNTILCIQGPPGTGKTFMISHVIVDLVQKGYKVGVTANTHRAICNVLKKIGGVDPEITLAKKQSSKKEEDVEALGGTDVFLVTSAAKGLDHQVLGGTVWTFASVASHDEFDYIFVDEATQVSLANLASISLACDNIILVGDQNQLDQPIKAAHPGEIGKSAFSYYTKGVEKIEPDRGIFLEKTYRMHPSICNYVSRMFYQGALLSASGRENQLVQSERGSESGIRLVEIEHFGNDCYSPEEVEKVVEIYSSYLGQTFVDVERRSNEITEEDILVVAPYNLHVAHLKDALCNGARVGTVDKFQGQEAPIVIVSMAASSIEDAPRGASFLLNPNRLNVAISRAKALAIVVASPNLQKLRPSNVLEMKYLNNWLALKQYSTQ